MRASGCFGLGRVLEGGLEAEKGAEAPVAKASRRTGN
jgi:hypothetical protein